MKEANCTFSIIIPTYNSGETLERCLKSILEQDFTDYEVLVIDGVSSDNTLTIAEEFQQLHSNIFLFSEMDGGVYDAMNKGIDRSNGNWVYFLGSDDTLFDKSVLFRVARCFKPADEIVYGNVVMRGKNQWNLDNVIFDGEYNLEKFIDRNICHQSIFFHKSVFIKNGNFNIKYPTNSDFDFNLRCFANIQFKYINIIIANFYVGGLSTIVEDVQFHNDRGALMVKYFGYKIFSKSFINARLYLQQAAFSKSSPLSLQHRIFSAAAYLKLKLQSLLIKSS